MEDADGVDEFVRVFFLVAEAEDGDGLAGEVGVGQLRQEFFPARLGQPGRFAWQFAVAECRAADDQALMGKKIGERGAPDVDRGAGQLAEFFGDLLGHQPCAAGVGAEEDADLFHFQAPAASSWVSSSGSTPTGSPRVPSGPFSKRTR